MKPEGISKGQEYLKGEIATNSESKNIRDLYRGLHEFEMADLLAYIKWVEESFCQVVECAWC
jgi:hypothetical protein